MITVGRGVNTAGKVAYSKKRRQVHFGSTTCPYKTSSKKLCLLPEYNSTHTKPCAHEHAGYGSTELLTPSGPGFFYNLLSVAQYNKENNVLKDGIGV